MRTEYPKTRLYVEDDLADRAVVPLSAAQAQHVTRVLRLSEGAPLAVFNGRDGEWLARLQAAGRRGLAAQVFAPARPQSAGPDLELVCAPLKRQPFDLLVQKATELGVRAIRPVMTVRTVPERIKRDRLRTIAIEAAEQCERLDVPEIADAVGFGAMLDGWRGERRLLVCDETGAGAPIAAALRGLRGGAWAVLTGPEGGFAPGELDALRDLPFVTRVGLGPRILRAETAAMAALAVWQALVGDWADAPPRRAP